jgi:hypothetical protein
VRVHVAGGERHGLTSCDPQPAPTNRKYMGALHATVGTIEVNPMPTVPRNRAVPNVYIPDAAAFDTSVPRAHHCEPMELDIADAVLALPSSCQRRKKVGE